tara:strand:+ start:2439 stop:3503 length:1065 start_codon:yes stop_codon:yes gene_type:complete
MKSTAMGMARRLVQTIGNVAISPNSITKEAITELMSDSSSPCMKVFDNNGHAEKYSHLSIFANEIPTLLSAGGNALGMIEFLTDIWDLPVMEVKTKNKGHDIIEGPFLTLLGCMTPETMKGFLFQNIISGGFTRRCLFVYSDKGAAAVPRPKFTKEQKDAFDRLVTEGKNIQRRQGEFVMSEETKTRFDSWYIQNHSLKQKIATPVMQGFLNSKAELVLKTAMLIAISESRDNIIEFVHFEAALNFVTNLEPGIEEIFEGTGRNELSPIAAKIMRYVKATDGVMEKTVLKDMFWNDVNADELDTMLQHLYAVGKLVEHIASKGDKVISMVSLPGVVQETIPTGTVEPLVDLSGV